MAPQNNKFPLSLSNISDLLKDIIFFPLFCPDPVELSVAHVTCKALTEEQGRAPPPTPYPYPFGQFEAAVVDRSRGWPLIWRS
jgi:hypothetical protein